MNIKLRKEQEKDYKAVFELIEKAFQKEVHSDHREQYLVERLRKSDAFIPGLSIVAELDGKIVGHILLSKIKIKNKTKTFHSLALAPVSVHPEFQGKGIGEKLILESHQIAKELGYKSIILLGHEQYYPKFGYKRADKYGIEIPFDAPPENCLVIELIENGLKDISGKVEYAKEFYQ